MTRTNINDTIHYSVVGVFGPRYNAERAVYSDTLAVFEHLDRFRLMHQAAHPDRVLSFVTGGSRGVELIAEEWCDNAGITHERIRPVKGVVDVFGHRNEQIVRACDTVIVFWDNQCVDVSRLIRQSVAFGRTVIILPVI